MDDFQASGNPAGNPKVKTPEGAVMNPEGD